MLSAMIARLRRCHKITSRVGSDTRQRIIATDGADQPGTVRHVASHRSSNPTKAKVLFSPSRTGDDPLAAKRYRVAVHTPGSRGCGTATM